MQHAGSFENEEYYSYFAQSHLGHIQSRDTFRPTTWVKTHMSMDYRQGYFHRSFVGGMIKSAVKLNTYFAIDRGTNYSVGE